MSLIASGLHLITREGFHGHFSVIVLNNENTEPFCAWVARSITQIHWGRSCVFASVPGSVLVRTRARILKIYSVCLRRGSVILLPLYSFRMVEKGIITVFCHFALLAFISKSVDARAGVSIYVSFNPFFLIFVNCFGSAYSFTKSGDRWLDRSAGCQNPTYRFLAIFVKRRAAKGKSL